MPLTSAWLDGRLKVLSRFQGVSVQSNSKGRALLVVSLLLGTPAHAAELEAGQPVELQPLLVQDNLDTEEQQDSYKATSDSTATKLDLTPRETDLAQQLCHGATLREAAQALQISEAHARQRLKVLMAKTGTSRQSEMLALFARLS